MKKIKKELVSAAKKIFRLGLNIGSEGNVSLKKDDIIFITPSGIDTPSLTELDISEVDLEGNVKNGIKPSSETQMHLSIYSSRPEINSIVHCHSEWATILSCQRREIPAFHYMVAEFGGSDIGCSKYATFGSKELAKNVLDVLKKRNGCLIANHGQLTLGLGLDKSINLAIALEKLSKEYFFCSIDNKQKLLSVDEMDKVVKLFASYKSKH